MRCPMCGFEVNSSECLASHGDLNVFAGPNILVFSYKPDTRPCVPCKGVGYFIWHVSGNRGRITCDTCAGTGRVLA